MLPEDRRRGRRGGPVVWVALAGLILALALGAALAPARPAVADQAMDFSDVNPDHPYYDAIEGLYWAGVIDGYDSPQGKMFRPSASVLRAQFAKMILGSLSVEVSESDWQDSNRPFADFEADDLTTLYPHDYVAVAFQLGITTGKTPIAFEPFVDIKRIQVISMVVRAARALNPAAVLDPPSGWTGVLASYYSDPNHGQNVRIAEYNGLLDGLVGMGSSWDADAKATRGEAAQIMWNLYNGGGQRPLYSDDFSDPKSGWPLKHEEGAFKCGYLALEPKCYSIELYSANQAAWAWRGAATFDDFSVGLNAGSVYGSVPGNFGLLFRMQDGENFYYFSVSNQGHWSLWKRQNGTWYGLVPATESDAIITGAAWNYLAVICEGPDITMFINDTEVGWASDYSFTSGWIGLMGESFDSGGIQMVFDDLEVWSLQ